MALRAHESRLHLAVARGFRSHVEHNKLNEGAAALGLSDTRLRRIRCTRLLHRDAKGNFQYLHHMHVRAGRKITSAYGGV
jgi:hypothetical protein